MKTKERKNNPYAKFNGQEKTDLFLRDAGADVPAVSAEAETVDAAGFASALTGENGLPAGHAYTADGTITLRDLHGVTVRDAAIRFPLVLEDCSDMTFAGVTFASLVDRSKNTVVENCRLSDLTVAGCGTVVRHAEAKTITVQDAVNALVALSVADSITVQGGHNVVCLLNRVKDLRADGAHSASVCENAVSGTLAFENCDHLIANGNRAGTVAARGLVHAVGDDVTDVHARVKCGVNTDILPQGDKDRFVYMPRRGTVRLAGEGENAMDYIRARAGKEPYVILPPGVYTVRGSLDLKEIEDGCVIYAYGVLFEKEEYHDGTLYIYRSKGVVVKGLTIGYTMNPNGQCVVIAKDESSRTLRAIAAAGMHPDWTDTRYFSQGGFYGYRPGHPEPYADMGGSFGFDLSGGEVTIGVSEDIFNRVAVGDTLVCRGAGARGVQITESRDTFFEDVTIFGAAGFAFNESSCLSATIMHRVWDTPLPARLIDELTYARYKQYEKTYGVDFNMREETARDGKKTYRGSAARCSSVDATHTNRSVEGTVCISCIFESMCDDGTNQNASHARLAGFRDNGDGTMTLFIKPNVSAFSFQHAGKRGGLCAPFSKGDRVYVYTSIGKLLCDSPALSDGRPTGVYVNEYGVEGNSFEVDVKAADFDVASCAGYDMETDAPNAAKILIDNMTRASNGFAFDNVLVQNIRSRGLLLKASNGTVIHCTFRGIGMSCIAILYEIYWGESGVSEYLLIKDNDFDNTGFYRNVPRYAPLAIEGLGSQASDDYLLYHNIRFEGNRMRRRGADYAVYLNSARQIEFINNDFGTAAGETAEKPLPSVFVNCAKDIEFSGNTYSPFMKEERGRIVAQGNRHIFGTDIKTPIPDDVNPALMATDSHVTDITMRFPRQTAEGRVIYDRTPWAIGSFPVGVHEFHPFEMMNKYGWFADGDDTIWNGTGGFWGTAMTAAAQKEHNVGFRYRVEWDGKAYISFNNLRVDPRQNGYLAIFKNGKMVFPKEGGRYTDAGDWQLLGPKADLSAMRKRLTELGIPVSVGDELTVIIRRDREWAQIAAIPTVCIF